ncbi:MAG: winged helix-turn-helix domain-containing protein [Kiloniellaceae bacterium]
MTEPRLRVLMGSSIAMGPGKADLLEAIGEEGSITGAARRMGMSYRRAWLLVETMNRCFRAPLVQASRGGPGGGGARLTPLGREALARYRAMEAKAQDCVARDMAEFRRLLSPRDPGSGSE